MQDGGPVTIPDGGPLTTPDGGPSLNIGAGNAPIGTPCVSPKVTVNATMTTAAIQAAINGAGDNAYICFSSGTYRLTGTLIPKAGQTFHGSPNTVMKGSVVLTGAVSAGANFVFSSVPLATTGPQTSVSKWCEDTVNYPCAYVEDVFFDGAPLERSTTLVGVAAGKFYTDYAEKKVYLGTNPAGHTVEIGNVSAAFRSTQAKVVIEGFIIEMFAHGMDHAAVELYGSTDTVFRNNEAFYNHADGVTTNSTGSLFQYNRFHDNGQAGAQSGGLNTVMDHNDFVHNNVFGYMKNDGAEGGLKVNFGKGAKVTNNYVYNNLSFGIYFDENANDAMIEGNLVDNNWAAGIIFWISDTATIAHNTVTNNGLSYTKGRGGTGCNPIDISCNWGGIALGDSANTDIYDNTLVGNAAGITLIEAFRASTAKLTIPELKNNQVHGNIVTMGPHSTGVKQASGPSGFDAFSAAANNKFYGNTYHLPDLAGKYFWWNSLINNSTVWKAAGQDTAGTFVSP